ncbi:adenine nucleotide translocase lysine N-methyltransferase isoform X4 [Syngnathoides biaculeatus]|nr:adenine nucleotide translocase lysine N-methyltransferase isoform X4 [Syngnathoides biaculeatus]XP_061673745.1 adenine nucleotide translocase lysine N-methyltransferase isoform X4 [Syngnathoides biaculeatus]
MKLLEGRTGRLADLGSGDGRLVCVRLRPNEKCVTFCVTYASFIAFPGDVAHISCRLFPGRICGVQSFAPQKEVTNRITLCCVQGRDLHFVIFRSKARWSGVPSSHATFFKKDFWKTDLSQYNNVTAFLAPGAMAALREKLLKELPDAACVVSSRYPFPGWSHQATLGSGLNQAWAYDVGAVRSGLRAKTRVP